MAATRLIFVRHGDAVISEPGQPRMLTPIGIDQARAAGQALADRAITKMWSSSMARAEQTAIVIGDVLGLPVHLDDRLRERKDEDPAPGITADDDDPDYVLERLKSIVADIAETCPGQTALLVTHGGITSQGLVTMCDNLAENHVATHQLGNCSISEITVDDAQKWTCLTWDGRPIVGIPDPLDVSVREIKMPNLKIVPFNAGHVAAAAELLAATPSSQDGASAALHISDPSQAQERIRQWSSDRPAVAATEGTLLVGFMAAQIPAQLGPSGIRIRLDQHAAAINGQRDIYRHLYASLTGPLVAQGGFDHMIEVDSADSGAVTALFELGFGIDQVKGVQPTTTPPMPCSDGIRHARLADLPALLDLTVALQHFHALPPMFRPALTDLGANSASFVEAIHADDRCVVVAEEKGRVVGMMQANPDSLYRDTATIGIAFVDTSRHRTGLGTAMLQAVFQWAAKQGFAACASEWSSSNPISDSFWRSRGFIPSKYKLVRHIDPRVSWANETLDYKRCLP